MEPELLKEFFHMSATDIGGSMRAVRELSGLTQTQVAKLAGVSCAAISNYESGKRKVSVDFLAQWAEALTLNLSIAVSIRRLVP